ncbi:hypothetical protein BHE74_00007746 [Ensete ventricosum]|nr:hypothetical protein BHE74_00007746 [Ensete ventricosum]
MRKVAREVEFRSVFRASSRKFKLLVIPNVLALGKSYEHGFMKKHTDHKLYIESRAKSSFAIPNVLAQAMSYEHDFVKKNDDHKLHANRVSIGFSRTISEIQNTGHSQRISRSDVICTVP